MEKLDFNILVVDDEEQLREMLVDIVEDCCTKVFEAENGKDALDIIENENINLILSDINMPIMNGIELLQELRDKQNQVEFIIVSAYADNESSRNIMRLGAFDIIDKPFQVDLIQNRVQNALLKVESDELEISLLSQLSEILGYKRNSDFKFVNHKTRSEYLKALLGVLTLKGEKFKS